VPRAAEEFSTFTRSLRHYAGRVGFTKLGSFGLLCFVVHTPTTREFKDLVARQKRGSAWHQNYCLSWLLDLATGEVHQHRGLPFTRFPGRRFFADVLRRGDG